MIEYDARNWTQTLFHVHEGVRTFRKPVAVCVITSIAVVAEHYWGPYKLNVPEKAHALIGVALGLLLVFRTNASYDRFWEARKMWGAIVNETRNVGRAAATLLGEDRALLERLLGWTIAFGWSTMHFLRHEKGLGAHAEQHLPAEERAQALARSCPPIAVSQKMSEVLLEARRRGLISDYVQMTLDQNAQLLIDYMGACQRIHRTPLPFAYVVHLRRALLVYGITLPFALLESFGHGTIAATFLISYTMFGIEEIGVEIEDPFGRDPNDLPLEAICTTIENDLKQVLAGAKRPGPVPVPVGASGAAPAQPQAEAPH